MTYVAYYRRTIPNCKDESEAQDAALNLARMFDMELTAFVDSRAKQDPLVDEAKALLEIELVDRATWHRIVEGLLARLAGKVQTMIEITEHPTYEYKEIPCMKNGLHLSVLNALGRDGWLWTGELRSVIESEESVKPLRALFVRERQ